MGGLTARFLFGAPAVGQWIFLAALAAGGGPLVAQTLLGILRGRFAADIVAMLAIVTALLLGQYFAGVVIVLMQSGGEALERYAMGRASQSLEALLARAPKVGHRIRGEQIEEVPVDRIEIGDLLLVRPGDLIPVDGEVTDGVSAVDQSALTGEPLPTRAVPGTALMSGSVNLDGAIRLRALRPAEQSQYRQIVRLVERARLEKPPIQRLADRFAVWFTPVTLVMCGVAWLDHRQSHERACGPRRGHAVPAHPRDARRGHRRNLPGGRPGRHRQDRRGDRAARPRASGGLRQDGDAHPRAPDGGADPHRERHFRG